MGKLELMGGAGPSAAVGSWTMIVLPESASAKLGSRGRVPVKGTINGVAFRSSAFPTGDGTHHITVNRGMRDGARVAAGERAKVVLEVDTAPRAAVVPAELRRALAADRAAKAAFDALSPSHRREIAGYVAEAKQAETRARRAAKTIAALAGGTWKPR